MKPLQINKTIMLPFKSVKAQNVLVNKQTKKVKLIIYFQELKTPQEIHSHCRKSGPQCKERMGNGRR